MQEGKWFSQEALQIAEKRREAKGKGERKRQTARRDKTSEQCKEIEKNNRIGKSRDLFKKTGDASGTFHAKMGTIKDRDSKNLTEAEEIKKRWQEYTELH